MLAHLCLKFRTDSEGLQQQETLDSLPKAIRSSISHFLFYSLLDKVYLFRGVSSDLLFRLVSEMKPEYFPPKEDVILQNEAPTDFYILVTGAVDLLIMKNGTEQVVGEARTGELCGEIGVLCYRLQLFTVRTKRLSQLLRLNRTTFLNIVQANVGDGTIIMNNLLQGNGTVINQNGLDIEALKTSRLPLSGSAQVGESRAVQVIGSSQAVAVSNDSNHPNMADNETAKVDSYSSGRPPVGPGSSSHDIFQGSIPHRSGKSFDHKSPSSLDTRSANSQSQERREAGNWEKQAVQSDSKKGVELS